MRFARDCACCGGKRGQGRKNELCRSCEDKLTAEYGVPKEDVAMAKTTYDGSADPSDIQTFRDIADLARRALTSKHWRWLSGMQTFCLHNPPDYVRTARLGAEFCEPCDGNEWLPDLTDSATLELMLTLVREATGDRFAQCSRCGDLYRVYSHVTGVTYGVGFKAECHVLALVQAPERTPVLAANVFRTSLQSVPAPKQLQKSRITRLVPVEILPPRESEGDVVDFRVSLSHNGADALLLRFKVVELRDLLARLLEERT